MIMENLEINNTSTKNNLHMKSFNNENLYIPNKIITLVIEDKLEDLSTYADYISVTDDQDKIVHVNNNLFYLIILLKLK